MFRTFKRRTDSSVVETEPQEPLFFALAGPKPECSTVPVLEPDLDPEQKMD